MTKRQKINRQKDGQTEKKVCITTYKWFFYTRKTFKVKTVIVKGPKNYYNCSVFLSRCFDKRHLDISFFIKFYTKIIKFTVLSLVLYQN